MLERSGFRYLFFLYLADILVTVCSLALATWLRYELPWGLGLTPQGQLTPQVYVTVMFIWTAMFYRFSTYNTKYLLSGFDAIERAIASVLASWLILAGTLFMTNRGVSRLLLVYFLVLNLAGVTVARVLMRLFIRTLQSRGVSAIRVLIIGAGKVGQELAERLTSRKQLGLELVGYLDDSPAKVGNVIDGYPILGSLDQAAEVVRKQGVDEVVIALPLHAYKRMEQVVASIQKTSANIKVVPDLFAMTLAAAIPEELDGIPLVGIKGPVIPDHIRLLKRVMDIVISSAGLVVLSPLMLFVALLIKLDSKGPVLFLQDRVGENGRIFRISKFRTMYVGSDGKQPSLLHAARDGRLVYEKRPDDPRITRIGRRLRRWSIDELPQLINILKGEMSLVGPRPEMPFLVDLYEPWQRARFAVPQGLTGWWQVNERSEKPMHLNTEYDLYYIQNYSLLLDLRIMLRTVGAVFRGRGAF